MKGFTGGNGRRRALRRGLGGCCEKSKVDGAGGQFRRLFQSLRQTTALSHHDSLGEGEAWAGLTDPESQACKMDDGLKVEGEREASTEPPPARGSGSRCIAAASCLSLIHCMN